MSSLLNTLTKALPGADTTTDDEPQTEPSSKYRIRVTGGPSYDSKTHRLVHVNGRDALSFENEFMHVKLKVRVRDYAGLPEASPSTSPYFTDPLHTKDLYSISFSFTPKTTIPSLDTVWGNDFDRPIKDRLPPGFNAAFKLAKQFVDPGLECDAYSDTPWVLGPALSCWFAFRVGEKGGVGLADVVCEGGDGDGEGIREGQGIPDGSEKRRKYFLTESNRADFDFEEGRQYQADFYNSYIDFGEMSLKLPGFTVKVLPYINDKTHTLRYVFKNRKTGDVYFVVVFTLLFGTELEEAVKADRVEAETSEGCKEGFEGVD